MSRRVVVVAMLALSAMQPGCGPRPVAGGSSGVLLAGGDLLGDIQVTLHQAEGDSWRAIGFGVTKIDGTFALVTVGATGPLWLSPGEYRCTLESVGAPVKVPDAYSRAETTPLKISWPTADGSLALEAPERFAPL